MPRDVSLDNPALTRDDDEFNRWPFSKRLADTIATFDTRGGSPIVGLFGKWGYGKSSVLNFLKDELKREHAGKIKIFEFNPWLFKNQETLLAEFFHGLAAAIDQSLGNAGKQAGKVLAKYGGVLSAIPVVGAGVGKFAEQVGKDLSAETLQSQRARVVEIMRDAPSTVVVLIDDLDRLDRDDIMTMLKLVRISANFPHVIYVLAFDDEMVARAAGEKYGGEEESGRQFLEKIIQYPFSLPAIRPDRLIEFVLRRAKEACTFADITLSEDDWEVFRGLVRDTLSVRLGTPRQAIRYANALRFALPMLKDEVDPLTQMVVEGLRTLFPELYAFARDKYMSLRERRENADPFVKDAMKGSSDDHIQAGKRLLLEFLDSQDRRIENPVFDPRFFDRYFSYAIAPEDISERAVHNLFKLAIEDSPEFATEFQRLAQIYAEEILDSFGRKVSKLKLVWEEAARLAGALAKAGSSFGPSGCNDLAKKVADLIVQILGNQLDCCQSDDEWSLMAREVIRQSAPLPFALFCLEELDKCRPGASEMIGPLHFDLCDRIRESAASKPPYLEFPPREALDLLNEWHKYKTHEEADWLTRRLRERPEEAASFLELFRVGRFSYREVTALVDPEVLSAIVTDQVALENQRSPGEQSSWIYVAREFLSKHEDAQWQNTIKNISESEKLSPSAFDALQQFLGSPKYHDQATNVVVELLSRTSDLHLFKELFNTALAPVNWNNIGRVLELDRAFYLRIKAWDKAKKQNDTDLLNKDEQAAYNFIMEASIIITWQIGGVLKTPRPPGVQIDLSRTLFRFGDWKGIDFDGANLAFAVLEWIDVQDAKLDGVTEFTGLALRGVAWWEVKSIDEDLLEDLKVNYRFNPNLEYGLCARNFSQQEYDAAISRLTSQLK